MSKTNEEWIYYLQFSDRLDDQYFVLQKEFSKKSITLIPIKLEYLLRIEHEDKQLKHLIVLVTQMANKLTLEGKMNSLLSRMGQSGEYCIYHISSFHQPLAHLLFKPNAYKYMNLPMNVEHLVAKVTHHIQYLKDLKLKKLAFKFYRA